MSHSFLTKSLYFDGVMEWVRLRVRIRGNYSGNQPEGGCISPKPKPCVKDFAAASAKTPPVCWLQLGSWSEQYVLWWVYIYVNMATIAGIILVKLSYGDMLGRLSPDPQYAEIRLKSESSNLQCTRCLSGLNCYGFSWLLYVRGKSQHESIK